MIGTAAGLLSLLLNVRHQWRSTSRESAVAAGTLSTARAEILRLWSDEAQDRRLLTGLLLPATVGSQDAQLWPTPLQPGDLETAVEVAERSPRGFGNIGVRFRRLLPWAVKRRPDITVQPHREPPPEGRGDPAADLWSAGHFQSSWARFILDRRDEPIRLVVHGAGGTGKTTLALMITIGIAAWPATASTGGDPGVDTTPLPLLVPLAGYDGGVPFADWVNRKVLRLYPSIDQVVPGSGNKRGQVGELLDRKLAILILDGFDEMPSETRLKAAKEIDGFLRHNEPLLLFSRADKPAKVRARIGVLAATMTLAPVNRPFIRHRQAYLLHRAELEDDDPAARDRLERFAEALPGLPALRDVLATPLLLELASQSIARGTDTVDHLADLAGNNQANALRGRLLASHIDWALHKDRPWRTLRGRRGARWLTSLARMMIDHDSHQLEWWQVVGTVNRPLLAVTAALSVTPAYYFALQMPVGLTRGLAIGCVVGVGAAFLRGRRIPAVAAPAVLVATAAPVVAIGTTMRGWQQGVTDALEIGFAVCAAFLLLDALLRSEYPRTFLRGRETEVRTRRRGPTRIGVPVVAVAVAGVIGTGPPVLFRLLTGFPDPERSPFMVFVGVTFGVGLATVAARAYIRSDEIQPAVVRFTLAERAEPLIIPFGVALLFVTSIGLGGAIGGAMRYGFDYGVAVFGVFAFAVGVPVGLVGGAVKWLCAPLAPKGSFVSEQGGSVEAGVDRPADGPRELVDHDVEPPDGAGGAEDGEPELVPAATTLRADRALAGGILFTTAAVAALSIWIMNTRFPCIVDTVRVHAPLYSIGPEDGLLIAFTLGIIVTCTYTAWPVFSAAHIWLAVRRQLPWRLRLLDEELQHALITIRDGDVYQFRYAGLRTYLGETLYQALRSGDNDPVLTDGEPRRPEAPVASR